MKTAFGIICTLLAFQTGNATDEAEQAIEKIISTNPDIDQQNLEQFKKNIDFGAKLKPHSNVDIADMGGRFGGEATVEPVQHDINDDPASVGGGSGLAVREYPGSTPVVHTDENNKGWKTPDAGHVFNMETRSYLSRDSLNTVREYYDKKVGKMRNGSLEYLTVPEGMRSEGMRPGPYIYAYPVGRRANTGLIGVEVQALEPMEKHFIRYPAVGPIFEKLNVSVVSGKTSQKRFDSLIDEYKHLAWMFYPLSDQRSRHGKLLSMDQVVFNGCVEKSGGGMSPEEMQAKMQQLMAQGRMQEMQQLAQDMMGASGAGSEDVWVDCLKAMEGEGYNTLVTIHVGPSQSN